jgi:carboxymethylenebutenolidase
MPTVRRGHGLIVIQEIFGVNAAMRKLCDDFAAQGAIAFCPDLFWRQQPNVQLTDRTPQEMKRASELLKGFDVEAAVRDLISLLGHIRKMDECNGKVGAVGYGLGGRLAYLLSARSDVDASVGYGATKLEKYLDEIHDIRTPLLLHLGALDPLTPADKFDKILRSAARSPFITAHIYENAGHDFALKDSQNYNEEAAKLADSRTKEFLAERLTI